MSKLGRPPSTEPAKLWDYRRMKTLVDALAEYQPDSLELSETLEVLCAGWEVQPIWDETGTLDIAKTVHVLARYTLKHGRYETLDKNRESDQT